MRTGASFDGVYVAQWAEGQKGGGGGDGGGRHGGTAGEGGWGVRAIGASHCDGSVEREGERERDRGPFLPYVCYRCKWLSEEVGRLAAVSVGPSKLTPVWLGGEIRKQTKNKTKTNCELKLMQLSQGTKQRATERTNDRS